MLERAQDAPSGVDAVKASGTVSKDDYKAVIEPLIDDARREGRRIRLLWECGPEFRSFTPAAGWEDLKTGTGAMRLFEGCAVVTDMRWIRDSTRLASFLMPCPVRVFDGQDREEALRWLVSLPEGPGVTHQLLTEPKVLVVEVEQPLRTQDFDALAQTADSWLETHDALSGVVVHARDFPGWENIGSLLRHVRFVRDHHRRIGRIALVADSKLAGLVPHFAHHFVQAEVRQFGYDELDDAVAWAASPPHPPVQTPVSKGRPTTKTAPHSTVGEVMTRDVVTVRPDTPFKEITSVLATHGISAVPVADARGAPMGLVSETDLLRKQVDQPDKYGEQAAPPEWPHERAKARAENAAGLMTTPVVTAHADWPVAQAAREMDRHRVRRLLVVDDTDRIIGIVSRSDLLRVFLRPDDEIREEIRDDVLAGMLRLGGREVQVQVHEGVVTLRGEVENRSTAEIAERLAKGVDGVVTVRPMIDYTVDDTAP
ncbi:STAS/SEC14 domain-containing protein [Streptomyces shenzhenensis]|uniref:STAS/SEC14 domain-containing protein n=1 Tax=Streptomyces shenzhenensis TaxID=943815 RepID=UPI001C69414D|nr:STAS/SEC14 domain-containing protein [Streptomyces shenzhenensis]